MEITTVDGYTLKNIAKINIILGINGVGKSTLLRQIEQSISSQPEKYCKSKCITPERGGELSYNASTDQSMSNDNK